MSSQEALQCVRLADSYLKDVENVVDQIEGDEERSYELLRTLELALKQLDKAEQMDSTVTFEKVDIPHFKGCALAYRGYIENVGLGKRSKAIATLKRAIETCEDVAEAHHGLGLIYSQTGGKEVGLRHLKRAVELEPENLDYRKDLDRLENVSSAVLKFGAFRGSWKVLLVLAGIFVLGLLIVGDSAQGGVFLMLSSLVIGIIYWMLKSR